MAYSTSDKYSTLVSDWNAEMASFVPTWSSFASLIDTNAAALRRWSDLPAGILPDIDPSSSSLDMTGPVTAYGSVAEQTITPQAKGGGFKLHQLDTRLDSSLVDRVAEKLLRSAQQTIEAGVYTFLASTFTAAVDNSNNSGSGDATSPVCSTHSGGSGGFWYDSDSNGVADAQFSTKIGVALDASNLSTARALMRKQKTFTGVPSGHGSGALTLVVPVDLEDAAITAAKSRELPTTFSATSATGANMNPQSTRSYEIVASGHLSDANDWWLIDGTRESPIKVWVPEVGRPQLTIWQNPGTGNLELGCSFYMKVFCDAPPVGIVGSSVS